MKAQIDAFETLMDDKAEVTVTLPMRDLFLLLCALRLPFRDPRLKPETQRLIRDIALICYAPILSKYPALYNEIMGEWLTET